MVATAQLTPGEQRYYAFLCGRLRTERPQCPSYQDIANEFQVSTHTVAYFLARLRHKGVLTWEDGKHRTLRLL